MRVHDVRWRVLEAVTNPLSKAFAGLPLVIWLTPYLDIADSGIRVSQQSPARGKHAVADRGRSASHESEQIECQARRHEPIEDQRHG
jgi:hypothetical protein